MKSWLADKILVDNRLYYIVRILSWVAREHFIGRGNRSMCDERVITQENHTCRKIDFCDWFDSFVIVIISLSLCASFEYSFLTLRIIAYIRMRHIVYHIRWNWRPLLSFRVSFVTRYFLTNLFRRLYMSLYRINTFHKQIEINIAPDSLLLLSSKKFHFILAIYN